MMLVKADIVPDAEAIVLSVVSGFMCIYGAQPSNVVCVQNEVKADGPPVWAPREGIVKTQVAGNYPQQFEYQVGHELTHALFIDRWPVTQLVQHEILAEYTTYLVMRDHGYSSASRQYAQAHIRDNHSHKLAAMICAEHWTTLREWNARPDQTSANMPSCLRENVYYMVWYLGSQIESRFGAAAFADACRSTLESRITSPIWAPLSWNDYGVLH